MLFDPILALLVVSRWMHFAALTVVVGSAAFWSLSARGGEGAAAARPLGATVRLLRVAAAVAAASGLAWSAGTVAYATGGFASLGDPVLLRVFLLETPFGTPAAIRLVLLAGLVPVAALPMAVGARLAAFVVVGGALLVSQAWLGHAIEGGDTPYGLAMIATYAVHVLAAAWWVGGFPALALVVIEARRTRDGRSLHALLGRYATATAIAVALIVASGSLNTAYHDGGSLADLRSTTYGAVLAAKVTLVAVMLGLAARNRFVLMPRLDRDDPAGETFRSLCASLAVDMALALLVLGVAAVLGVTPPPR